MQDHYRIAILGAGIGGLGMAARLKMTGQTDFIILEKADRVGGTWRDNVYPGAACDVQSHLYWYSFDEQPDWTRLYPGQPEIHRNIERMVARHELRPHIRFNAEVVDARWDEDAGHWVIRTGAGQTVTADIFIAAQGQLNRPTFRDIKGIDSFHGPWFHSARWNHDVQLGGKRVASVGNGCSAVQFIPELVKDVAHLTIFQRSANYIVPRLDRQYADEERAKFLRDLEARAQSRKFFYDEHETWIGAMRQGTEKAAEFTAVARMQLDAQVGNPELRAKLWPDYPIGCKRIIISDDYYPALTRMNVAVITDAIEQVESKGIRTRDGTLHELDAIVYATGFETLSFLGTLNIEGRGAKLRELWKDGPEAYLGLTIAGFPNMFMLYGPNTNLGHNSIIEMLECQFEYVLQGIAALKGKRALELKTDVMRTYNEQVQDSLRGSSWDGGCNSWYKNKHGKITNNWTGTVEDYKARTAKFHKREYVLA